MRFKNPGKGVYRKLLDSAKEGEVVLIPMDDRLLEDSRPYKAGGKNLPDWFKDAPKEGVRNCAGIQDYLNLGFIIPAWTDFSFDPRPELGGWDLQIGQLPFAIHPFISDPFPRKTTGSCPMTSVREIDDSPYPKLVNPWNFITAPGWSLMVFGILHEPNIHYDVVPAIVNTDYYHHINIVLNLKNDKPFKIEYGQPLAHIIPFKRSGNTEKLNFATEKEFKYIVSRGIGKGQMKDDGNIGRAYRRLKRQNNDQ